MEKALPPMSSRLVEYAFDEPTPPGLFICAGGFEARALSFIRGLTRPQFRFAASLVLCYENQFPENQKNLSYILDRLRYLHGATPEVVGVNSKKPNQTLRALRETVLTASAKLRYQAVVIDISGMSQMLALCSIHACFSAGLPVTIVYTEARSYFPTKPEGEKLIRAWNDQNFEVAARYLQSQGLKSIHILSEFAGSFRPTKPTCLMVFLGYEPNRIEGLIDRYAPDRLVALYGRSPHERFRWRTTLSKRLHEPLLENVPVRKREVSTLEVDEIVSALEAEFDVLHEFYEIAIAPQCSKMQAVATYLFWLQHPEVQLVFTSPVRFNPEHYSRGSSKTFVYELPAQAVRPMYLAK
jgi:hypothetical protein